MVYQNVWQGKHIKLGSVLKNLEPGPVNTNCGRGLVYTKLGVWAGKYELGTGAAKYKMGAAVPKYKLETGNQGCDWWPEPGDRGWTTKTLKILPICFILSALLYLKLSPYQQIYHLNLYELLYSPYKAVWGIPKLILKAWTTSFTGLKLISVFCF